jgi:SsrA-binding protein
MARNTVNIVNKKARHEYFILDTYVAGIVLLGTEIKSVREGKVSLAETYCIIEKAEVFIKNMNIAAYTHGNIFNHEPKRTRKLLLTAREIRKLDGKVKEKGFTLVVTRLFINDKGLAKVEIALAKGKKLYDKRDSIKERDMDRYGD